MDFFRHMGAWDYVAFGGVAFLVIRGFWRGCSGEISGIVGLLAAGAVGYFGFGPIERTVFAAKVFDANPYAGRLIAFILILVVCFAVWLVLGRVLKEALQLVVRQPFDALLGGVLGGVKAFAAVAALCALGLLNPSAAERAKLQSHSVTVKKLAPLLQRFTLPGRPPPGDTATPRKDQK